jgi:hypothetical protein
MLHAMLYAMLQAMLYDMLQFMLQAMLYAMLYDKNDTAAWLYHKTWCVHDNIIMCGDCVIISLFVTLLYLACIIVNRKERYAIDNAICYAIWYGMV